jgi:phosphate:Na+ symporter
MAGKQTIMGTMVLLDLMGAVALLLWGLHMVHSGVLRAFGPDLRLLLAKALSNRFTAFAAGLGLTALLQSSTATALITSSFTSEGLVSLVPALAIMLGANVGTTLIVQILSFNIAAIAPVLFVIGLVAFRSGPRSRIKDIGRVGLMLLALHILLDTLAPAENAPGVRVFMDAITGDPVLLHCLRRTCDLGGAFERRQCVIGNVARICTFHFALCGVGAGARRQSRQRYQSHF